MWCYLEGGDRGPAKKACATACARAGNPIAILDASGNLYVAAGLKDHQPASRTAASRYLHRYDQMRSRQARVFA